MIEVDEKKLIKTLCGSLINFDKSPDAVFADIKTVLKDYLGVYTVNNEYTLDKLVEQIIKETYLEWVQSCIKS